MKTNYEAYKILMQKYQDVINAGIAPIEEWYENRKTKKVYHQYLAETCNAFASSSVCILCVSVGYGDERRPNCHLCLWNYCDEGYGIIPFACINDNYEKIEMTRSAEALLSVLQERVNEMNKIIINYEEDDGV